MNSGNVFTTSFLAREIKMPPRLVDSWRQLSSELFAECYLLEHIFCD